MYYRHDPEPPRPPYLRQPASPATWILAALILFVQLWRWSLLVFFVLAVVLAVVIFGGT